MRVGITLNTSWNIYNFRMGLVSALIENGHEVIAFAPEDEYSKKLQEAGCLFVPIKIENTGANPIKDFLLFRQLRRQYKLHQPDIIFHYTVKPNIYGTLAAKALKIPVINNVSGLGTVFLSEGLTSLVAKKLYRWAFAYADMVFFQNKDDQLHFLDEINLPSLKTDLLPGSGINLTHFEPKPMETTEDKIFLMISRLLIDKGVSEYIEAAHIVRQEFPKAKFQLLGKLDSSHARGIPEETIRRAVDLDQIEYLGEQVDVRPYIGRASCVVLPSYREGTPRTILEAAAMARPAIVTNVPGCKEVVINERTGLLCRVRDASDLADKMIQCAKMSNKELSVWGRNGRLMVEKNFDEKIVVDQYLKYASNIMK